MTKTEFLRLMRSKRDRWDAWIDKIANEDKGQPGADGDWSIRELVIHVTAYERGLVEWLEAAQQGEVKEFPILDHKDVDHRNRQILEQHIGLSVLEAEAEARKIFERLMALIEEIPEEDLLDPDRVEWYVKPRWKEKRALWECIADDSYRHYEQHIGNVRKWVETKKHERSEAYNMSPEQFIEGYEAALATQDWQAVSPYIHQDACVTFSTGDFYQGKAEVQKAYERNFKLIEDEKYSITELQWVRKTEQYAVCIYAFRWQGFIKGEPARGSGRGTATIIKENGKWYLLAEHLGPIAN